MRDEYPCVSYFQEKGSRVLPGSRPNIEATEALIEYAHKNPTEKMLGHLCTSWTLEPGGFARTLLGEKQSDQVSEWAVGSAACVRAAMAKLNEVSRNPQQTEEKR